MRILIADDHKIMREGLHSLLERSDGIEVVGEANDGRTALDMALKLSPDIVIMDVTMPLLNGIEATQQITKERPEIKIIALSIHSDRRFIARMFKAGARGYLVKDCAFEELAEAIKTVGENHNYISPCITDIVVQDYINHITISEAWKPYDLSPREREVLQLIAEGQNVREMANELHVSVKTVETHRQKIMQKLDIHSVAELTKFAIREGLTAP